MDRKRAKELLPIIQAFCEGEDIQKKDLIHFDDTLNVWYDTDDITGKGEYRIKPKPREWWIAKKDIPESGSYGTRVYLTTCDHSGDDNFIKVREVL